jgi:TatD DNase family protein
MIDAHCHLEQKDYNDDRDNVIKECRKHLDAIVTCCAHPDDLELTLELVNKYYGFVFCVVGLHPEYAHEIDDDKVNEFINRIKENKDKIVGIGEVGLDYYWVKDEKFREKQKEVFEIFIDLANKLNLPLVIHGRDAFEDCIKILEKFNTKHVLMHLFGEPKLLQQVIDNGWYITLGPIVLRSKKHKKLTRDVPLERILTETDSPWFGNGERGTPLNVKKVISRIAEIKKIDEECVDRITTQNAVEFFKLKFKP